MPCRLARDDGDGAGVGGRLRGDWHLSCGELNNAPQRKRERESEKERAQRSPLVATGVQRKRKKREWIDKRKKSLSLGSIAERLVDSSSQFLASLLLGIAFCLQGYSRDYRILLL